MSDKLKPFEFHGVEFTGEVGDSSTADCPFCSREKTFAVNKLTGQWICPKCNHKGNAVSWLADFWGKCGEDTSPEDLKKLSGDRKIPVSWLQEKGVVFDREKVRWLVPTTSFRGTFQDLRCAKLRKKIIGTAGCKTGLWNAHELAASPKGSTVYVCEGEWDGIALTLLQNRIGFSGVVVAVPGAQIFKADWVDYFKGMKVVFLYDNDGDGDSGSWKASRMISIVSASVRFLCWPESFVDKYDIRDHVVSMPKTPKRCWKEITELIRDKHRRHDELSTGEKGTGRSERVRRPAAEVPTFEDVIAVYRKWLKMTPDLVDALLTCCAVVLSNQLPGDPVWLYLVGPPSSGKSEILCSLSKCPDTFFQSSVHREALISGFRSVNGSDPSLIPLMIGKTAIFKDWTEMLSSNPIALEDTNKILRGAYDGSVLKTFGNGVVREYKGRFSMLAGVTNSIHGFSNATMGERFLKFQLGNLNRNQTRELLRSAARGVLQEGAKNAELQDIADAFLDRDIPTPDFDEFVSDEILDRLAALAEMIGILRHEIDRDFRGDIKVMPAPEFGARLIKQLTKLGMSVALTLGRDTIDADSWRIVERVAFDTAIGFNLDLVQAMVNLDGSKLRIDELSKKTRIPFSTMVKKMEDLKLLGVVYKDDKIAPIGGGRPAQTYKLGRKISRLWKAANVAGDHVEAAITARMKA